MLVGRRSERALIERLLGRAREGGGGALIVRGDPGIGKTTLLAHAAEHAAGMRVLRARGVEAEADVPFAGIVDLLRPLAGLVDALPAPQAEALRGALGLGPRVEGKLLVGVATLGLLSAAAEEQPVLCLVDDAHWLDEVSADALLFAARRVQDDPVAFLLAARVGESQRLAAAAIDVLELEGLAAEEARELLEAAGHGLPADVADRLCGAVRGNPLALLELPAVLADEQRAGTQALTEPLPVTAAVQQAFARRIERLPAAARRALAVAAAESSDRAPPVEQALAALGIDAAVLGVAEDAGLVALSAGRIAFRHPLVRAASYHGAQASWRRAAHAALAGATSDPDTRAWHLAAAATGADEHAATALEDAAERAKAQGTVLAAAAAYERAADVSPDGEARARRLRLAARAYARSRERSAMTHGRAVVGEGLRHARDPVTFAELSYWQTFFELEVGPRRAFQLGMRTARALAARDPAFAALVAGEATVAGLWYLGDDEALAASAEARRLARRPGGPRDPFVALVRAHALVRSGELRAARPLQEAAARVLEQFARFAEVAADYSELLPMYRSVVMYRASVLIADAAQMEALVSLLRRMRALWGPLGDGAVLLVTSLYPARFEFELGRWDDARAGLAQAEQTYREFDERRGLWLACTTLATLAAARGDETDSVAYTAAAAEVAPPFVHDGVVGSGAPGLLALGEGEYDRAAADYERAVLPRVGRLALSHELADAIEALARAGRREEARRWLEPFAAQAGASGWPWAQARAAHLDGLLADDASFDEPFGRALGLHERARQPFPRARTELAYGERLRRAGLRRAARERLRSALESFESLGAAPWAERAAAELRGTGERVRRRRDAATAQLTPQELQVALVVARGATNREAAAQLFLSPKTIEKHLGSTYAKLGIRSRTELAALVGASGAELAAPAG